LGKQTTICPACGSGKITPYKDDDDKQMYKCQMCTWFGSINELVSVPMPADQFALEIGQDEALNVVKQISEQYLKLLATQAGQQIGLCIIQAGFCTSRDSKALARLLRAACVGAHKATLEEAQKMSEEIQNASKPS